MATRKCKHGKLKKSVRTKKGYKRKCKKKRTKKGSKSNMKKSYKVSIKRRKSTNRPYLRLPSNCVGLDEDTCNSDSNCLYRKGGKNKPHCALRSH